MNKNLFEVYKDGFNRTYTIKTYVLYNGNWAFEIVDYLKDIMAFGGEHPSSFHALVAGRNRFKKLYKIVKVPKSLIPDWESPTSERFYSKPPITTTKKGTR